MECPFCSIDTSRTSIIEETKFSKVLLSNPRLVPGHLLVIPKKHYEKLSGLPVDERTDLFNTVIKYQDIIISQLTPGCDIRQNYRPFQEENDVKVDHIHIHILPRTIKDEYYQKVQKSEKELFTWLSNEEKQEMTHVLSG